MSWNTGPYPQQDPNQGYYGNPYPPQQPPYPGGPPPPGAPPMAGYPAMPPTGFHPPPPQQPPYGAPPYGSPQQPPYGGDPAQGGMYGGASYADDPEVKGFDFSDKSIRRGFIRKVYAILMLQLSISLAFIAWFMYHEPTRRYVHGHQALFWVALALVFASLIAIACCGEVRRKAPMNYVLLFVFTGAESFLLGCSASTFKAEEVMMAVGITAAVCLGLTLFAFQTRFDFTMCGGILFVACLILMIFGIVTIFVHGKVIKMVYASLGALLFSVYLIYDTQLMMGGSHKYSISPEEYVFAALNLYVDVINIFLYILTIIGASRD